VIDEEAEANAFAMELLMPKQMVIQEVRRIGYSLGDDHKLRLLAARFQVPLDIMAVRIGAIAAEEGKL
jgi:Zn-dependent peptidase ImmA (M78 family)